jgi:hypothetical protein
MDHSFLGGGEDDGAEKKTLLVRSVFFDRIFFNLTFGFLRWKGAPTAVPYVNVSYL